MIPAAAPMMNTITVKKSIRSPLPDTMSAIVPIMYSYLPRMRRMKLPDIPGSIMAHIAMAPQMRMNQSPSGVSVGERVQTTTPRMMPKTSITKSFTFHALMPFRMNMDDATMRPKKKAHVWIGWWFSRYCISLARERMLMRIPVISDSRKLPLICFQNCLNFPVKSSFSAVMLMLFIDPTRSS